MRKQTVVKIDDKEIVIREITVREIREFWQDFETAPAAGIDGIYGVLERFVPTCIFGVTIKDFDDMPPSDIKRIYDAFTEVNDVFFGAARLVKGENPLIAGLQEVIIPLLMMRFAGFFAPGMQESLTTGTDSLSTPSIS
jgi:hypothetical protein